MTKTKKAKVSRKGVRSFIQTLPEDLIKTKPSRKMLAHAEETRRRKSPKAGDRAAPLEPIETTEALVGPASPHNSVRAFPLSSAARVRQLAELNGFVFYSHSLNIIPNQSRRLFEALSNSKFGLKPEADQALIDHVLFLCERRLGISVTTKVKV